MFPLPPAEILPDDSTFYAILMGFGLILGVYAHAGRFHRLLAFAILWVFVTTILTMVAARTMSGGPPDGVELP